jgi:hypothetical protein
MGFSDGARLGHTEQGVFNFMEPGAPHVHVDLRVKAQLEPAVFLHASPPPRPHSTAENAWNSHWMARGPINH